jgi:hypothetical protein
MTDQSHDVSLTDTDPRSPVAGSTTHASTDAPHESVVENDGRETQRDAYVAEITARLRHVCQHLTDTEFTRLVADMAETKLRFMAIDGHPWGFAVPRKAG